MQVDNYSKSVTKENPKTGRVFSPAIQNLRDQVGEDTLQEILQSFLGSLETACNEMKKSSLEFDWKSVKFVAHRLRSSCALLGCHSLESICMELETLCERSTLRQSSSEVDARIESFLEEQGRIRGALTELLTSV